MTFDMAWDFRSTTGFVTDPAYAVAVTASQVYPTTFTNSNGDSVNAGYVSVGLASQDLNSANDPRLAGDNYSQGASYTFRVDLGSGSAPGAGDYTVDLAMGFNNFGTTQYFSLKDTATMLIDATAGANPGGNNFIDATLTSRPYNTSPWSGATTTKTFATTQANLITNPPGVQYTAFTHFRLTAAAAAPPLPGITITPRRAFKLGSVT